MSSISHQPGRQNLILDQLSADEREILRTDSAAANALAALAAYSPALTQALAVKPALATWLFIEHHYKNPAEPDHMSDQLAGCLQNVTGFENLQQVLRQYRLQEMARLAVRDLTGRADLHEVMATLTGLAEACLAQALKYALAATARRYHLTPETLGLTPVILGMGKLGAKELNYSSDIDLIYLYKQGPASPGAPPAATVAQYLYTLVTRALAEVTEDGLVFRVDLDLRPGGKDGAQAQSLEAAHKHYLALGQPWERLALLKARPVAGDRQAGQELLTELIPFIFRRHLDYTSLEELKDLKARFARQKWTKLTRPGAAGRGPSRPEVIDVKVSPGGIRQVEFFVQALILTFGGRLPHLREPTTLGALAALTREKIISRADQDDLTQAYIFLRTVEHRVQLRELTQTQTLPKSPEAREALARSLGFTLHPWPDFMKRLSAHMAQIRARFDLVLAEPDQEKVAAAAVSDQDPLAWAMRLMEHLEENEVALELLAQAGFKRPVAALAAARNIRQEKYLPGQLSRYGVHLERLMPALFGATTRTVDPDRALLHLERFLRSIGPKAGFLLLLEENPNLIRLLAVLFGSSDHLSEILIHHPAILDSLIDRRSARLVKDKDILTRELETMLAREGDPEDCLNIIRRFKNDEILRIGLYDLLDKITWPQVQAQLTHVAEVVLARSLRLAHRVLFGTDIVPHSLAVMGLGKLGGQELSYSSDLDLLFILDPGSGQAMDMLAAVKLAQRLIGFLSMPLDAGPGYQIDSRLRPSGSQGPLVVTTSSFARYHETSQLWERQALLKIRHILGPSRIGARIKKLAMEAIYNRILPIDAAEQIHQVRQRMTKERGRIKPGLTSLKFSPGGLVDAEFLTQYLQMLHGREAPGRVRAVSTNRALKTLAAEGLGPPELGDAAPAYEFLGRVAGRLGLVYNRSGDKAAYTPEEIVSAGLTNDEVNLWDKVRQALTVITKVYRQVFGLEDSLVTSHEQ